MFRNPKFRIIMGSIGLAIALGWAVDFITAHVAVEYFSKHHPNPLGIESPVALALYWGFAASWWFGLIAGALLAWVNGRRAEPHPPRAILILVAKGCAAIWLAMMVVMIGVYMIGGLVPVERRGATFEQDRRLMAVAIAHLGEYVIGAAVALVLAILIGRRKSAPDATDG